MRHEAGKSGHGAGGVGNRLGEVQEGQGHIWQPGTGRRETRQDGHRAGGERRRMGKLPDKSRAVPVQCKSVRPPTLPRRGGPKS